MYTNIDITEGVRTIVQLLSRNGYTPGQSTWYGKLLLWVLRNNYFSYGNITYKQVKGIAMGSKVPPAFANLFMMHHEIRMFKVINKPLIYKRYLDDVFLVCNSEDEFQRMFSYMQNMTPSLKFTYVKCTKSLNFLDLNVNLDKFFRSGKISHGLYQKPESRHFLFTP